MKLQDIKGIGENKLKILNKLNIKTIEELITYYPFRYNIIKRTDITNLQDEDKVIIDGIVETMPNVFYFNRKKDKMSFKLNTNNLLLNIIIFNRGFLKLKLTVGTTITVIGKYDKKNNNIVAQEIRLEPLKEKPSIEPIYHTTNGITGKQINNLINNTLKEVRKVKDYIPEYLNKKYKFIDKLESIKMVHNPTDIDILRSARTK